MTHKSHSKTKYLAYVHWPVCHHPLQWAVWSERRASTPPSLHPPRWSCFSCVNDSFHISTLPFVCLLPLSYPLFSPRLFSPTLTAFRSQRVCTPRNNEKRERGGGGKFQSTFYHRRKMWWKDCSGTCRSILSGFNWSVFLTFFRFQNVPSILYIYRFVTLTTSDFQSSLAACISVGANILRLIF